MKDVRPFYAHDDETKCVMIKKTKDSLMGKNDDVAASPYLT